MQPDLIKKLNKATLCLLTLALMACADTPEKNDQESASVHLQLGVRYLDLGRLALAKENLELALSEDADNYQAHDALAFLYEKINKYPEARAHYEMALNLASDDTRVQNNFGRFLCDRREYEQGLELLTKASANMLNDKPWLALTNAGRCQMAMGENKKAEVYFKQALQSNPRYAPALQEMQRISYLNNNYMGARAYFQRYLSVARYSPETLWMAIQTERALNNDEQAKEYQTKLLEDFSSSNEAKQIDATLRRRMQQQQQQ